MAENRNVQQVREITDKLEQGLKELFESERFKEYLKTMSKFYNYSFNNTLLIAMQKPDATLIAGYTAWQRNFDRHVMKGEKGIKILAPAPYKVQEEREKLDPATQRPVLDKDGKPVTETVEVTRPAFKVVSVFDVSQTDGKELPDIAVDELTGSVENYAAFFDALKELSPAPIAFENITDGAKGYFSHVENRIAIQEGMSEIQTIKTAIHEIAHAKLHAVTPGEKVAPEDKKDRRTKEVEAESVAYTVCQRYGIETSGMAVDGHIGTWHTIDHKEIDGHTFWLMEHDTFGDDASCIIVDERGELVLSHIYDGFDETAVNLLRQEVMPVEKMPDDSISIEDMKQYGYKWGGMLPMREEAAAEVMKSCQIYRLYGDDTEGLVLEAKEIKEHAAKGGIFGVEKADWVAELEKQNPLKAAEMSLEDDYGMIDGIINNGPKEDKSSEKGGKASIMDRLKSAKTAQQTDKPSPHKEKKSEREL